MYDYTTDTKINKVKIGKKHIHAIYNITNDNTTNQIKCSSLSYLKI